MSTQPSLFKAQRVPEAFFSACGTHGGACSSEACQGRRYRYTLRWPTGEDNDRECCFVLANPSTASASEVDPTVRRCIAYAKRWGYGWCVVVNVRAWRATDPKAVPADPLAVGISNDIVIFEAALRAELVVCGWGELGGSQGAVALELIRKAGKLPHALKLNADGSPAHPLYLRNSLEPMAMPTDGEKHQ